MRFLFQVVFVVVTALCITEMYLRWMPTKSASEDFFRSDMAKAHALVVDQRITDHWNAKNKAAEKYFFPPHVVFLNEDIEDTDRLKTIAAAAKFPPSKTTKTANFLRSDKDAEISAFTVTTNALGFRDKPRTIEKGADTFRILLLGTYPAFGHGVSDNETYASRLEYHLRASHPHKKFEVWNMARQGTTAISGLALLETEAFQYQPDLILWDFGWVDMFTKTEYADYPSRTKKRKILQPVQRVFYAVCGDIDSIMRSLLLCGHFNRRLSSLVKAKQLESWRRVYARAIQLAQSHSVPMLLIRHNPVHVQWDEYKRLEDTAKSIYVVDTTEFVKAVPDLEKLKNDFWSRTPTWVDEIGGTRESVKNKTETLVRGDAIFYNANGYDLLARGLHKKISELFPPPSVTVAQ